MTGPLNKLNKSNPSAIGYSLSAIHPRPSSNPSAIGYSPSAIHPSHSSHKSPSSHSRRSHLAPRTSAAFSLIEILITIGLLSFIILGLMLMFQQVQKAFRSSMTQTDVMESGRSITDMIARDLEEMAPLQLPYVPRFLTDTNWQNSLQISLNFMTGSSAYSPLPVLQLLPGTNAAGTYRTNIIQNCFFTTKSNQTYVGVGYCVLTNYADPTGIDGLGTLYRYTTNCNRYYATNLPMMFFTSATYPTNLNMHRIADGVVHFRVRAFATNGSPIFLTNSTLPWLAFPSFTNDTRNPPQPGYAQPVVTNARGTNEFNGLTDYWFYSNAVPAYVELEIGFLEQRTLDRYRAMAEGSIASARSYLTNHPGNVQIFRQRIPIRSVDYAAYQ